MGSLIEVRIAILRLRRKRFPVTLELRAELIELQTSLLKVDQSRGRLLGRLGEQQSVLPLGLDIGEAGTFHGRQKKLHACQRRSLLRAADEFRERDFFFRSEVLSHHRTHLLNHSVESCGRERR